MIRLSAWPSAAIPAVFLDECGIAFAGVCS
jgi:hypothetical protein